MRNIAISDIHGCNKTFHQLLDNIKYSSTDQLFLLGDYIDRGPDSKGVLDTIMDLQEKGHRVHCLKGNHEQMLQNAIGSNDYQLSYGWQFHGGKQTLASFGVSSEKQIPDKYLTFMADLEYYIENDDFILVHAGLNFTSNEDPLTLEHSMLWIRDWYDDLDIDWLGERKIIHGHTPTPFIEIEKNFNDIRFSRVLDIDAGCCFDTRQGLGKLCALDMTNMKLYHQQNIETTSTHM